MDIKKVLGMTILMGVLVFVLTGMVYLQPSSKSEAQTVKYELKGCPQLPVSSQKGFSAL